MVPVNTSTSSPGSAMTCVMDRWAPGDQIYGGTSGVCKHLGGARSASCSSHTAARWIPGHMATMRYRSSAVCLPQSISHVDALAAWD